MFDSERYTIPEAFAEMTPGPVLSAFISKVDRSRMNGYDLVNLMKAQARLVAYAQAELAATIREVAHCPAGDAGSAPERSEDIDEFSADEIRAALRLTRRSADIELGTALDLVERLPAVWSALHAGELDLRRARTIAHGTEHLDEELSREVAAKALEHAPQQTTGELAARIRRLCIDHDPADAAKRFQTAVEERRVIAEQNSDGTANLLGLQLLPDQVQAARHRIDQIARRLRHSDETRTIDQLRADVFLDLLTGKDGHKSGFPATANIVVDLTTLAELDDKAGELPGMGPVIADIARQVAGRAQTWTYQVTDPDTGETVATGVTRRRPNARQKRTVAAAHPTCVFPGCRMPAADCDLDHTVAWAEGGPTTEANLEPACRHDHRLNHEGGWTIRLRSDGRYQWISRLGHRYITGRGRSP
jgi:hypothetical protein